MLNKNISSSLEAYKLGLGDIFLDGLPIYNFCRAIFLYENHRQVE